MAEINIPANNAGKPGVARSKKLSTRVDLTPMVDLGFLLITFFIFSSRLSEPKALRLYMPANGEAGATAESTALTVIPFEGNKVFYYHGMLENALQQGGYGITNYDVSKGLGNVIREKQKSMGVHRNELMVMIKPADASRFVNMVDVLDEMQINAVKRYAIMDLTKEEKEIIQVKAGIAF